MVGGIPPVAPVREAAAPTVGRCIKASLEIAFAPAYILKTITT
jgi:hypothetical protein